MKHVSFFIFTCLFLTNVLFGQRIVTGKVNSIKDKKPLSGCSIFNINKQIGTVANENGVFELQVNTGDLIQASYLGMKVSEQYISDSTDFIFFELEHIINQLKEVNITQKNLIKSSLMYNPESEKIRKVYQPSIFDYTSKSNLMSMLFTPWDYFYYTFNKRVQRRLEYMLKLRKQELAETIFTLDFISMITREKDEDELIAIRRHCNFGEDEIISLSQYDLGVKLKSCYIDYMNNREKLKNIKPYNFEIIPIEPSIKISTKDSIDIRN